ncbi:hypothetical protein QBC43DRAFT_306728 [Cladorrhinum sp. PSN259]|nr:hypothetical protein QBC43DRAFT_306728 [Cladorrhinum sp. PSN259]
MMNFPSLKRGNPLIPLGGVVLCIWLLVLYMRSDTTPTPYNSDIKTNTGDPSRGRIVVTPPDVKPKFTTPSHTVGVVVASLKKENTTWIQEQLPRDWVPSIYVVDDETAKLTVPVNKGREAMVYLTYIIDNYFSLPEVSLFIHASRFAWHNDNPDYDSLTSLLSLQIPYIKSEGYVNLRCVWVLGCPTEFRPIEDVNPMWTDFRKSHPPNGHTVTTKEVYKQAFEELLPGEEVPTNVGVSCCAQFALSKDRLRTRKREEYVRWRTWLLETPLVDEVSGRVFEYMWHVIFGKEGVFCPSAEECYCKLYGWCNLNECSEKGCGKQYTLPKVATLPQGWPLIGWQGEERNYSGPAL